MRNDSTYEMTLYDYYLKEKQRYLEGCVQCGYCAKGCPILPYVNTKGFSNQEIQEKVFEFIDRGEFNFQAYTKAFACMECFKCTSGLCPESLNPMLINELIKGETIARGVAEIK